MVDPGFRENGRRRIQPRRPDEGILDEVVVKRVRRWLLRLGVKHVFGPRRVDYAEDELVVLCLVRDGRPYVKSFVEHYTSLGVRHMVFLDNGSTDGTVEALKEYGNVTVLRTGLPYKKYKYLMKQYLHARFGGGRWSLYVDIDELFDYPYSGVVGLRSLLGYLSSKSYTAVAAHMLDMFPERPLTGKIEGLDEPVKELHRFYDISRLWRRKAKDNPRLRGNVIGSEEIETFSGGIRRILFGVAPNLTKFPLVFSDGRVKPANNSSHKVDGARIADFTCVLFHYKFLDHFHEHAQRAAREGNYYADSFEYKKYLEVLKRSPELRIKQQTSREIEDVNDLVGRGFLFVSDDYAAYADSEDERDVLRRGEPRGISGALLESRRRERARDQEMRELAMKIQDQEREMRGLRREARELRRAKGPKTNNRHLEQQVHNLTRQIESVQSSRAWRLLGVLHRARTRILRLGRSR